MRMSCNGCRVLRKGCSDDCAIRPCLQWIRSPDAQGHATVFLAKFYGRAGLINLISAGPDNARPAIFRSLLYEACGRMLNPLYGSVGLLWSGDWQLCQAAVENVLRGMPIAQTTPPAAAAAAVPPLKTCDIRHVARRGDAVAADMIHQVANSSRGQFKRRGAQRLATSTDTATKWPTTSMLADALHAQPLNYWAPGNKPSHQGYSGNHGAAGPETDDSNTSVDTVAVSHVSHQSEPDAPRETDGCEVGLDLALGILPPTTAHKIKPSHVDDVDQHCHRGQLVVKIGFES